jgi:deoxycytidine triphosphate deaminase
MVLSKTAITRAIDEGKLSIDPLNISNLKEASYTFTLSDRIKTHGQEISISNEGYNLEPGEFLLAYSAETLDLKNNYCCMLSARGSVAQMGINVLLGSNFCEPDTNSSIAIEIHNTSDKTYRLEKGMSIMKGIFIEMIS